jgi:hypothetical protein
VILDLTAWAERLGIGAVFIPLAFAGLFTLFLMFVQSIARLFDD